MTPDQTPGDAGGPAVSARTRARSAVSSALPLDVTDPASVVAAAEGAEQEFGRIDILVNNAGYGYLAAVEEGEDAAVRALYDTNVHGVVTVLKAVLPGTRERRSGRIVNISSSGGLAAFAATGHYHATKFALEGLSESLAAEVAPPGIAVTVVEPGGLRTQWAGTSMRQSPTRLADYEQTAGRRRAATLAVSGRQPGDPVRAAAAIAAVVDAAAPPLRLLLGSDALAGTRARLERLRHEIDANEASPAAPTWSGPPEPRPLTVSRHAAP
ncbi:SDR family NAD(P)-dependent oxidoreductase [Streptomyces sp. NPDC059906]|uniref:SDR family NAD(P)-dependent oxidoreductase n=1 Tax=Streptomyces sp. NPDC059906 TaxID=3346997 RepID=UPI00365BCB12